MISSPMGGSFGFGGTLKPVMGAILLDRIGEGTKRISCLHVRSGRCSNSGLKNDSCRGCASASGGESKLDVGAAAQSGEAIRASHIPVCLTSAPNRPPCWGTRCAAAARTGGEGALGQTYAAAHCERLWVVGMGAGAGGMQCWATRRGMCASRGRQQVAAGDASLLPVPLEAGTSTVMVPSVRFTRLHSKPQSQTRSLTVSIRHRVTLWRCTSTQTGDKFASLGEEPRVIVRNQRRT